MVLKSISKTVLLCTMAAVLGLAGCQSQPAPEPEAEETVERVVPEIPSARGPSSPPGVDGPTTPPPDSMTETEAIRFELPEA